MARLATIITIVLMLCLGLTSQSVFALGGQATIESKNDKLVNSGKIGAVQTTSNGTAIQYVGQRVRAPQANGSVTFKSSGNTYKNDGWIVGVQTTLGGKATQVVGQEIY